MLTRAEAGFAECFTGSGGEGVEVAGEDRPSGQDLHPVMALESRSAQSLAAVEVTDPSFDSCAVGARRLRVRREPGSC